MTKATILYENEGQWTTEQLIQIGSDLFYRTVNGGSDGARDPRDFHRQCYALEMTAARAQLLAWGVDPEEVVRILEPEEPTEETTVAVSAGRTNEEEA